MMGGRSRKKKISGWKDRKSSSSRSLGYMTRAVAPTISPTRIAAADSGR
jgi:hypothetical protein